MMHLDRIDFLRGIAIMMVFAYHLSVEIFGVPYEIKYVGGFFLNPSDFSTDQLVKNFLPSAFGWAGVELFLVISGFLIHLNYLQKGKFVPALFFNKRFWRIWPPYMIALVFFALTVPANNIREFLSHAFLVHNLNESDFFSINPSFWSLALEMQLYAIYPLFLLFRKKFGVKKTVVGIFLLQMALTTTGALLHITSARYQSFVLNYWIVWVMGAYLAECFFHGKRLVPLTFNQLLLVLACVIGLRFTAVYLHFSFLFFSIFFVLLLDWILHTEHTTLLSGKAYKFVISIGLFSYSIYLFHQPHLGWIIERLTFGAHPAYTAVAAVLAFLFFYCLSYVTYKLIELPSIKFGTQFYKKVFQKKVATSAGVSLKQSV